jgi:hypothetical protein
MGESINPESNVTHIMHPSQESMEEAYDQLGLAGAPEAVLDDDRVAQQQYDLAAQIDAATGRPSEPA